MKVTGKMFENKTREALGNIFHYRLNDNVAWMSKNAKFTPSNYSDFIVFHDNELFFLEVKTIKGKSIPFKNFTKGQWKGMYNITTLKDPNIHYIVLIYFYEYDGLYMINSDDLLDFEKETDRKSFPLSLFKSKGLIIDVNKYHDFKIKDEFYLLSERRHKEWLQSSIKY